MARSRGSDYSATRGGSGGGSSSGASYGRGGAARGFGRGGGGFPSRTSDAPPSTTRAPRDIVVLLVNAGLWLGHDGLVDAFDRGIATNAADIKNETVVHARPDIVHQCLLGIFDSEFGAAGRVRVFISTTKGKTIEVSPSLRPPRTFDRFKGLMATLLRDGNVTPQAAASPDCDGRHAASDARPLLQILQGSVAPLIPEGAEVIGITNSKFAPIATPLAVAEYCGRNPASQELRGGRKGAVAFFCIDCRDEGDAADEPCVTKLVSLSPYPQAPHTQAIRLCEGFNFLQCAKARQADAAVPAASGASTVGATGVRQPARRQRDE